MFVEQAIFTSVRTGRNEGYQIASASPGITLAEKRELSQWGPGHDALYDPRSLADSVNSHRLDSGRYCISRTLYAGREYSGRGGYRVYTHFFLVPESLLQRFCFHPLRVMEAAIVAGRAGVLTPIPDQLGPAPLVGRAQATNVAQVERLCQTLGPEKLATLVCAALKTETLGVHASVPAQRLFSGLLDLLPTSHRTAFSFTTGLRVSPRRCYRLAALPDNVEEQRQAVRLMHLAVLDLDAAPPPRFAARSGWPLLVYELMRTQRFETLALVIQETATVNETDIDLLAEQARARIDRESPMPDLITPFSA